MKSYLLRPRSLFFLFLTLVLGACQKPPSGPDEKILFKAIEDNIKAFDEKNTDAVMDTIHPQAPNYAQTRSFVDDMFRKITLKFTVNDLKVITSSPQEAQVSFVQRTEKVENGQTTPLNIIEGVHTLRPDHGVWKIYSTLNTKVVRLDVGNDKATGTKSPSSNEPPTDNIKPAQTLPVPESKPAPAEKPAQ